METDLVQLRSIGAKGAVLTPAPWTYSASQLRTYHDCARKWFFAKILKYPTGTSKAAEYGKDLHGQVEKYIQDGTEPTDDRAWALLRNLGGVDLTREDLTVEGKVQFLVRAGEMGGPRFLGYIDLIEPTSESLRIIDHKTTSDLKWAKSEYELHSDIQMIAYAHWAFMQLPHLNELEVVHNYVTTKGVPTPRVVTATLTRSEVTERWNQDHLALIEKMEVTRQLDDVRNVPVTLSSCGKYGGCPHSEVCARAQFGQEIEMFNPPDAAQPGETKEATMSNSALDRLAALRARAGIATAPAPEKVEAKEPEQVATSAEVEAGDAILVEVPAKIEPEVEGLEVIASEPEPAPEESQRDTSEDTRVFTSAEIEAAGKMMGEATQTGYELSAALTDYGFGKRALRALEAFQVETVEQFMGVDVQRAYDLKNCGQKVVDELMEAQGYFENKAEEDALKANALDGSALGASPVPEPALVEASGLAGLAEREQGEVEALQELTSHRPILPPGFSFYDGGAGEDMNLSQLKAMAERFGAKITIEIGG